ncbi:MAG TPA: hypothetical protein DIW47_01585 [Bacteroidetes bacterium]|nr:hypothetical protein [Bacteroidota bacterium]
MKQPIVDAELLLEKYPGKGGWTYAAVPNNLPVKRSGFGWVKVKGTIDGYAINDFSLAPMKGGQLFLPVKAAIRKIINKQAGDYVKVVLFPDDSIFEVPEEILESLKADELAYRRFIKLTTGKKREYVKWIFAVKNIDLQTNRILQLMEILLKEKP